MFERLRELAEIGRKPFTHSCVLCSMMSCSELEERAEWQAAVDMLKIFEVLDLYEDALREVCDDTGDDFTMGCYASKRELENSKDVAIADAWNTAANALKRAKEIAGE